MACALKETEKVHHKLINKSFVVYLYFSTNKYFSSGKVCDVESDFIGLMGTLAPLLQGYCIELHYTVQVGVVLLLSAPLRVA